MHFQLHPVIGIGEQGGGEPFREASAFSSCCSMADTRQGTESGDGMPSIGAGGVGKGQQDRSG